MVKTWTDPGWSDYLALQTDKKLLKKTNELLKDIERHPFEGLGKPEPLRDDLSGYWSRRIDEKNRIVYRVFDLNGESAVEILYCGTHYHK